MREDPSTRPAPPRPKSRKRRRRRKPRGGAQAHVQVSAQAEEPAPAGVEAFRLNTDNPFAMCDDEDADAPPFDLDPAEEPAMAAAIEQTALAEAALWPEAAEPEADDAAPLVLSQVATEAAVEAQPRGFGPEQPALRRAPHIVVHARCERGDVADAIAAAARDPRLARAEITIESGGIDAAIAALARAASPDLLILDTTAPRAELLRRLEKLADVVFEETKVIIIGVENDITFFRDLTARGVSDYVVAPVVARDLADTICALYADAPGGGGRVIAVTGARGGVGASSLARNIAWSIAERQEAGAALIDFDLAFTAAAPLDGAQFAVADALQALAALDEDALAHFGTLRGRRLRVLGARASLTRNVDMQGEAIEALIAHVRNDAHYIVLDVPHLWTPWTKAALAQADQVVIAAVRDLASLRNAKNMIEALKGARAEGLAAPEVVLSMAGMPGRPEIPAKDMSEVLGAAPVASIPFDAYAFGASEAEGLMIDECAPGSRAAHAIDALASRLTGRKIVRRVRTRAAPAVPLVVTPPNEPTYPPAPRRRREDFAPAAAVAAKPETPSVAAEPPPAPVAPAPARQARVRSIDAARYTRALAEIEAGRARKAASLLRAAAQQGLAPAQQRLALLYVHGDGVKSDPARARSWTARAAEAGNVQAMVDLGDFCARGEGGARDEAEALHWFQRAAAHGHRDAQHKLGHIHAHGVRADAEEALYWFLLAARQGDGAASGEAAAIAAGLPLARVEHVEARVAGFRAQAASDTANALLRTG